MFICRNLKKICCFLSLFLARVLYWKHYKLVCHNDFRYSDGRWCLQHGKQQHEKDLSFQIGIQTHALRFFSLSTYLKMFVSCHSMFEGSTFSALACQRSRSFILLRLRKTYLKGTGDSKLILSFRDEISFMVKWNVFNSVSGQSLICGHFDKNEFSFQVINAM